MAWIARIHRTALVLLLLAIFAVHGFVLVCTRPSPDGISGLGSFKVLQVAGTSMEPVLRQGDVIFVRPLSPDATILKGDIITFRTPESAVLVTHRVVDIVLTDSGPDAYVTKGDANSAPDTAPVFREQVVGRYAFRIPLLGRLSRWIRHPAGLVITGMVLVRLLLTETDIRWLTRTES